MQHYSICFWCDSNQSSVYAKANCTTNECGTRTKPQQCDKLIPAFLSQRWCAVSWSRCDHLHGLNLWLIMLMFVKSNPGSPSSVLFFFLSSIPVFQLSLHCCCLVSTFPPPQHLPSSLISSSPKHRLQLLELFTPFLLFSLLQLVLSSPGYFPYLCVINIKKQERLPFPPAPHCESLQPASDSASLAVTS